MIAEPVTFIPFWPSKLPIILAAFIGIIDCMGLADGSADAIGAVEGLGAIDGSVLMVGAIDTEGELPLPSDISFEPHAVVTIDKLRAIQANNKGVRFILTSPISVIFELALVYRTKLLQLLGKD
ncbi:hypothetical protein PSAB_15250 [Paenibacillus sabinae T27]|uniref:Uncharacterized protein n=1 Tax=Paenibacillus sabinae T27 TaxID=1268072 RepID=X4ZKZ0_9BACL|nr:hypothetical protein PSAB_15250 [Paenibacillus sabinae T27]